MRQRKRIVFCVMGILILSVAAGYAQERPDRSKLLEKLKAELSLTEEQIPAVKAAIDETKAKRKEILDDSRSQGESDGSAVQSRMKELFKEEDSKLSKILSAEQLAKFREIRKEMRKKAAGERKSDPGDMAGRTSESGE
jgi:hypothetical protein